MSNMSYCRFQNTLNDLLDCETALGELYNGEMDSAISEDETSHAAKLIELCMKIADEARKMSGIGEEDAFTADDASDMLTSFNEDAPDSSDSEHDEDEYGC